MIEEIFLGEGLKVGQIFYNMMEKPSGPGAVDVLSDLIFNISVHGALRCSICCWLRWGRGISSSLWAGK